MTGEGDELILNLSRQNNTRFQCAKMNRPLYRCCFVVLLLGAPGLGDEKDKRTDVPPEAAQRQSLELIDEVFESEFRAAKTPKEKNALALQLLKQSRESQDDSAHRFVLLRLARDIAIRAGDPTTLVTNVQDIERQFEIDGLEMLVNSLGKLRLSARSIEAKETLVSVCNDLLDRVVAEDRYDHIDAVAAIARRTATSLKNVELTRDLNKRISEVQRAAKAYAKIESAEATLAERPDDPDANLAVGRYLCFVKGDWEQGLLNLALSADAELQAVAQRELAGADDSSAQLALGDRWWKLNENETNGADDAMRRRAAHWYRLALPQLSGLAEVKAKRRIQIVFGKDEPINEWVDLIAAVDPKKHTRDGTWNKTDKTFTVTQLNENGANLVLKNTATGSYELRVSFDRKSGDLVGIRLPVGKNHCYVKVATHYLGLAPVNGSQAHEARNPTCQRIRTNSIGTLHVVVKLDSDDGSATIDVELNGKNVISWRGSPSALDGQTSEGFGFHAWEAKASFTKAAYRRITG